MRPRPLGAVALLAAVAGLAPACGGRSDDRQVRDTLARYERFTAVQDYRSLCDKVLSRSLVQRITSVGLRCDQALRIGLGGVRQPRLAVLRVAVTGGRARALVRSTAAGQPPSTDTIELVRDGGQWRLSALTGRTPAAPAAGKRIGE